MRRFTRVVLAIAALAVGAGSVRLRAQSQDPEPVPVVTPEPVEQVIVAPADEAAAPATVSQEEAPVAAPLAEETNQPAARTTTRLDRQRYKLVFMESSLVKGGRECKSCANQALRR